jgi:hypothetical protein
VSCQTADNLRAQKEFGKCKDAREMLMEIFYLEEERKKADRLLQLL